MLVFTLVITLLLMGAVLAALARRVIVPYPALLALAGAGLALLSNLPVVTLDPELALTLLVAPVLLDAAFDSSPRDLRRNWRAVTGLALAAVGLTVVAVASIARSARSWPRPMPRPRRRCSPSCVRPTASSSSSRARACSTTPARGSSIGSRWRRQSPAASRAGRHRVPILISAKLRIRSYAAVGRWRGAKIGAAGAAVVAWCGMRGIVTLAAAPALPEGGSAGFPSRDFILFTAFSVVLGTLVVQGMTVGPLMKLVALRDDGSVDREVRLARAETARAAVDGTMGDGAAGGGAAEMVGSLRRKYQARLLRGEQDEDALDPAEADGWREFGGVQRLAYARERQRLSDLRARGVIGDDAFHRVEEELDRAAVNAESRRL